MRKFQFKAKDEQGRTLKGRVEAVDEKGAVEVLRRRKLLVIDLRWLRERSEWGFLVRWLQKVKTDEVVNFTRQLSTMITAGLPMTQALSILEMQSGAAMGSVVGEVLRDVEGGMALAQAMEKHKKVFSSVYVALVRAGEAAGVLDQVLKRLAETMEKQREFRNKTKGALIYPAIVVSGMVVVGGVMMVFVVPKLTVMYADFGAQLPLPTRILMTVSGFMAAFWWLMALVVGVAAAGVRLWAKTPWGAIQVDSWLFKVPIVGVLRREMMFTEMTRTLGLLVTSGISILEGLRIVTDAMGSPIYAGKLRLAAVAVEKGLPLAATLAADEAFPPLLSQMMSVGEETGKLDEVLIKLSAYFEGEAETKIRALTTALEPLIMILLGVGVGFLIVAVIMPIYNLTSKF